MKHLQIFVAAAVFATAGCVTQCQDNDFGCMRERSASPYLTELNSWRKISFPDSNLSIVFENPYDQGFLDGRLWYKYTLTLVFSPVISCHMETLSSYECGWKDGERYEFEQFFKGQQYNGEETDVVLHFSRSMLLAEGVNPDISFPPEIRQYLPVVEITSNQVQEPE